MGFFLFYLVGVRGFELSYESKVKTSFCSPYLFPRHYLFPLFGFEKQGFSGTGAGLGARDLEFRQYRRVALGNYETFVVPLPALRKSFPRPPALLGRFSGLVPMGLI